MYHVAFLLSNSIGVQIVQSLLGLMSLNQVHLGCTSLYSLHLETDRYICVCKKKHRSKAFFFLNNLGDSLFYMSVVFKLVELELPNLAVYLSSLDGKPLQLILSSSS